MELGKKHGYIWFYFLFSVLGFMVFSACTKRIEPAPDFSINFCNFPHAWTESKGKNVSIGIVSAGKEDAEDWVKKVSSLAPESNVILIEREAFLAGDNSVFEHQVILLAQSIEEEDKDKAIDSIKKCRERDVVFILPVYFGPMEKDKDYSRWQEFIKKASENGAVIVGAHGMMYQLGKLSFWKKIPVDIFALHDEVGGDRLWGTESLIERYLEKPSYLVAGAAALLRSKSPELSPEEVRNIIQERGRKVIWMVSDVKWRKDEDWLRAWPVLNREILREKEKQLQENNHKIVEIFEGHCLDAAMMLGLKPMVDGEWPRKVLNVSKAQKIATGKGVTVAILDHMFEPEDWSLKGRVVKPGSVLEGAPVFDPETGLGHGTWMAQELVRIAPDVMIMPVRFCGRGRYGEADLYIKGIEYAAENGADIISLSHQPLSSDRQADFDRAIEEAAEKGVTLVYIHYQGERKDVVVTKPIEFAPYYNGSEYVYVIGTNFIDESKFPMTWGVSSTAPMVSGVIAMMKELNPKLTPKEIREILLKSGRELESGFKVLDAVKALQNSK
jgi:subtilisin family serine protease